MKVNFKNIILLIAIVALMIIGVSIFNGITKEQAFKISDVDS